MDISSIGPVEGGPEEFKARLAEAGQAFEGRTLTIVYLPIDADHGAFLRAAADALPGTVVVGATTSGASFTERGATSNGVVAGIIGGPELDFHVAVASNLSGEPEQSVANATSSLVDAARRRMLRSASVVTLADPFACEGDRLLAALVASTPPHWHHLGATAGDSWKFERTLVFANGEVRTNAAVLIGLFSATGPQLGVQHGWCAVPEGREFTVTEIEGDRLITLDEKPAARVYAEELLRLGSISDVGASLEETAGFELGARTLHGELKIRAPIAFNEDGSITLASGLPRGTVLRIVSASADALIQSARSLADRVLSPISDRGVAGALVFDCGARLKLLGDRYREQTAAFSGGRSFPIIGLAGYGEIARFGGSVEGFHNATAVMAAW